MAAESTTFIQQNDILNNCKLFFLENQEYGNIKLIIYNSEKKQGSDILMILFVGEKYHVITNNKNHFLEDDEAKELQIALNLAFSQHEKNSCNKLALIQNNNLKSFPDLCDTLIKIISQIENNQNGQ